MPPDEIKRDRREVIAIGNSAGILLHTDERDRLGGLEPGDTLELVQQEDGTLRLAAPQQD